ncbi:hypothetical protein, partial [Pseudomonas paraeruginosa]|uniref:hypothetical protein n=1 Tax=Pseudomonas paraeruginosa TaxID=2994495 RepID=UPI003A4C6F22
FKIKHYFHPSIPRAQVKILPLSASTSFKLFNPERSAAAKILLEKRGQIYFSYSNFGDCAHAELLKAITRQTMRPYLGIAKFLYGICAGASMLEKSE